MKTGWILVFCVSFAGGLWADTITHGGTTVEMGFQTIGQAGNAADTTGYGAVDYTYRIGTYEVTVDQWNSAVAADGNIEHGSIWTTYNTGSQPVDQVSWIEAARFCNWLTSGNALQGAYLFSDVDTLTGMDRSAAVSLYGMVYVLPTEDEWYKAAYFTGSGYSLYADGTDSAPSFSGWNYDYWGELWNVGSGYAEQNGTYDMMGNAYELTESAYDGVIDNIMLEDWVVRGGVLRRG
jgi:formylglycine-generating enzyme required for sulfatase activity